MERPILFNTEMVKAILDGRKTQTRRIIKPQPDEITQCPIGFVDLSTNSKNQGKYCWCSDEYGVISSYAKPPYQIGDILWVRETWKDLSDNNGEYVYLADDNKGLKGKGFGAADIDYIKWKPSIHMPKSAARIFLKVTDVKVERLDNITEEDALKEGIKICQSGGYVLPGSKYDQLGLCHSSAEIAFRVGFNEIYPKQENPWLWVIEFERYIDERRL